MNVYFVRKEHLQCILGMIPIGWMCLSFFWVWPQLRIATIELFVKKQSIEQVGVSAWEGGVMVSTGRSCGRDT